MLELLKKLCDARGVTGDEKEIGALIAELAAPLADKVERDALGNVLAFKKGRSSEKTVMADAHMDEVGILVNYITDDGSLKFTGVGVDARVLNGRRFLIGDKRVPAVAGTKPIHLQSMEEREIAPPMEKLYLDIGAKDADEARKYVKIGDTGIFDSEFVTFGDGLVKARALDNRIGCAALLKAMEQQPAYDTWYVFSVLEESGGFGARVATDRIRPDLAIVIDTTTCADFVEKPAAAKSTILGNGTVIFLMESTTYYNPKSVAKVKKIAADAGVKWQHKSVTLGGLNSGSIQRTSGGCETVAIATPCRYLHSAACTAKLSDMEETSKLLNALLASTEL
ncbi:MAG: M42 family peptidase [Clostridia bacterium]|nr:M42 family peptidase [Clostridia bacterium]MBQ3077228.1 M42 family peptidase [Clostridia bacterium]